MASGCTKARKTTKLTIAVKEELTKDDSTTKLAGNGFHGEYNDQCSTGEAMLEYRFVFALGFSLGV